MKITNMTHPRRTKGFSLLEVLIALIVLSLGLLGLAGLQAYAMRNNQSANYRTQATNLAYQMSDLIRSYRGASGSVADGRNNPNIQSLIAGWDTADFKGAVANCSATSTDSICLSRRAWETALTTQLPNGRARIAFTDVSSSSLDGSGVVVIEICWTDDRTQADAGNAPSTDCAGASDGYGMQTIGPDGSADWTNNAAWVVSRI